MLQCLCSSRSFALNGEAKCVAASAWAEVLTKRIVQAPVKGSQVFKWEERKGWDVLLSAFLEEFSSAEPVSLTLLTHPFHGDGNFAAQMHNWATETFGVPGAHTSTNQPSAG